MSDREKQREAILTASRKYTLADVVAAWRSGDWAKMADAARLYPSLVTAIQSDPLLAFTSLWGHKRAKQLEKKMRVLVFAMRREEIAKVPGGRQLVDQAQTPRPIVLPEESVDEVDALAGEILADPEDE